MVENMGSEYARSQTDDIPISNNAFSLTTKGATELEKSGPLQEVMERFL